MFPKFVVEAFEIASPIERVIDVLDDKRKFHGVGIPKTCVPATVEVATVVEAKRVAEYPTFDGVELIAVLVVPTTNLNAGANPDVEVYTASVLPEHISGVWFGSVFTKVVRTTDVVETVKLPHNTNPSGDFVIFPLSSRTY